MKSCTPVLIVVGGFPGAGKTTLTQWVSVEFSLPHLSADSIGQVIRQSAAVKDGRVNAAWFAHDILFGLCRDFLGSGVSVILDLNMGWRFQWEYLDSIKGQFPAVRIIPFILKCRREVCLERLDRRYQANPEDADPPATYTTSAHIRDVFTFLEQLDRTDIYLINTEQPREAMYQEVRNYLQPLFGSR